MTGSTRLAPVLSREESVRRRRRARRLFLAAFIVVELAGWSVAVLGLVAFVRAVVR